MSHIDTGDVLLVVTAVREVARRSQAVRNAQLITSIVESSDDAIVGATLRGTITSWNPAAERLFGYSSEEVIGMSGAAFETEDEVSEMRDAIAKLKAGQTVEHLETKHLRKDGTTVPVSRTMAPIHDPDGSVMGASGIARDLSQQRHAARYARKATETARLMAAIVQDCHDAILSVGLDGAITSWNPAARRMYGYLPEEIIGRSAELLTTRGTTAHLESLRKQDRADRPPLERLETNAVRKDGTVFPISVTISPIHDETGEVVGTSAIHRDLTGQK